MFLLKTEDRWVFTMEILYIFRILRNDEIWIAKYKIWDCARKKLTSVQEKEKAEKITKNVRN